MSPFSLLNTNRLVTLPLRTYYPAPQNVSSSWSIVGKHLIVVLKRKTFILYFFHSVRAKNPANSHHQCDNHQVSRILIFLPDQARRSYSDNVFLYQIIARRYPISIL